MIESNKKHFRLKKKKKKKLEKNFLFYFIKMLKAHLYVSVLYYLSVLLGDNIQIVRQKGKNQSASL